ncbi:Zinc transporter ZIP10 [Nymphon striatum]|nr:Zinc transporter ZIP10 [Nymphon striatum]
MKLCSVKYVIRNWANVSFGVFFVLTLNHAIWCSDVSNATKVARNSSDPVNQYFFLNAIFQKYGNNGTMNFEGFEHLLFNLGLGGLKINDHNLSDHKPNPQAKEFSVNHGSHNHGLEGTTTESSHRNRRHAQSSDEVDSSAFDNDDNYFNDIDFENLFVAENPEKEDKECLSPTNLLKVFNLNIEKNLSISNFLHICPAIVYELDEKHCVKDAAATPHIHPDDDTMESVHDEESPSSKNVILKLAEDLFDDGYRIYMDNYYSSPALFSKLIIHQTEAVGTVRFDRKCMQDELKKNVLVKEGEHGNILAVRWKDKKDVTMHSTVLRNKRRSEVWTYACISILVISLCGFISVGAVPLMHRSFYNQLLKFLVALAIGTLTGDALLHLIPHALSSGEHENESAMSADNSVWKGLVALLGIYFFFIAERIIGIVTIVCQGRKAKGESDEMDDIPIKGKKNAIGEKLSGHQKHDSYGYANPDPNSSLHLLDIKSTDPSAGQSNAKKKELEANGNHLTNLGDFSETQFDSSGVVTIVEKPPLNGHGHGHSHEVPASISAVAYMVIMGDGLHNFTDGLAIGAAFAANITGGFSTSIAVFCHELPHELGDFAVLLKSGMTTKQALFYNFISSILCFIGMLIGVAIGNLESVSNWVFAAAAGMFIYISLVDMVPQLQNHDSGKPKVTDLLLHLAGIFSGVSLMLLIALYEQDLKKAMG